MKFIVDGDPESVSRLRHADIPAQRLALLMSARTPQEARLVRRIQLALEALDGVPEALLAQWAEQGGIPGISG